MGFANKMKRSVIMFQQNAQEMLKRCQLKHSDNDTFDEMAKLLEKRCEELHTTIRKAKSNQTKLNKRLKKMKLAVMKNPKLTDELGLLFDSNKTGLNKLLVG